MPTLLSSHWLPPPPFVHSLAVQSTTTPIFVDNLPLTSAFHKRYAKTVPETSLILRSFCLLCTCLSCEPHIRFLPHCSTPLNLVDFVSCQSFPPPPVPTPVKTLSPSSHLNLFFWLQHPTLNWNLPFPLIDDLRSSLSSHFVIFLN
jgi:hypothetical protein